MPNPISERIADTLQQAIEHCDLELLLDCYTGDADLRVVDSEHPPSQPLDLHGKDAIRDYFQRQCDGRTHHHVDQAVVSDNHITITETATYPDGRRALAIEVYVLDNGKVFRQTVMQAWDH